MKTILVQYSGLDLIMSGTADYQYVGHLSAPSSSGGPLGSQGLSQQLRSGSGRKLLLQCARQ